MFNTKRRNLEQRLEELRQLEMEATADLEAERSRHERTKDELGKTQAQLKQLNIELQQLHIELADAQADKHALQVDVDRLAKWFSDKAPKKIREGGAIQNAIRLLDEQQNDVLAYRVLQDEANATMTTMQTGHSEEVARLNAEIERLKTALNRDATTEVSKELAAEIEQAMEQPETLNRDRGRPKRKNGN